MNIQVPPSPASPTSNDWPGPQKYRNYNQPPIPGNQGRRNLATPPTSGSSFGTTVNMANGINGRPGDFRRNPSPPNSITARSSNGSSQNEAAQRRKQSMMEESLYQHYRTLQRYLASSQRDEASEGKPNRARDKLVRLSPIQFQELSTDVYDELLRRQAYAVRQQNPSSPGVPDYLIPKDGFHPKRNQARQKLSTLPVGRFRALATDVFYELERRIPKFAAGGVGRNGSPANGMRGPQSRTGTPNGMRPGSRDEMRRMPPRDGSLGMNGGAYGPDGPMQKSSQSNTIVPNKSYLVEDDDEADGESVYGLSKRDTGNTNRSFGANEKIISDYQSKVEDLQAKISNLELNVKEKDSLIEDLEQRGQSREQENNEASEGWASLRQDLEAKLAAAETLNINLQSEIDKAQNLHADKEQNFREQLDMMATKSGEDEQWKLKHNELLQQIQSLKQENQELQQDSQELQQELLEQQRVTDEVRREATGFLEEMKVLARQSTGGPAREEKLMDQVQSLEGEVEMWKTRFAQCKAQSWPSTLVHPLKQSKIENDASLLDKHGLIKDTHVMEFQVAIDEAIRMSRDDPQGLDRQLKSVVRTVLNISNDLKRADDSDENMDKMKTRVTGTACNFITATKNYLRYHPLSPVSLLDSAASHLSGAVVVAVQNVKMYSSEGEAGRDSALSGSLSTLSVADKSGKYYSTNGRSSASESIYSSATAPRASDYQSMINGRPNMTHGAPNETTNGMSNAGQNYNFEEHAEDLMNLKADLDDQTSTLIDTIQHLVTSIRSGAEPPAVRSDISVINTSVTAVLRALQSAIDSAPASSPLREVVGGQVRSLAGQKARLLEAEDEGWGRQSFESWREVANGLPPIAFDIARQVRDVVAKVGDLANGRGVDGGDDFS